MGLRIMHDTERNVACLFCSTSDWAFGPVFYDQDGQDAYERADAFCKWLGCDARTYTNSDLENKYYQWRVEQDKAAERARILAQSDTEEALDGAVRALLPEVAP